MRSNKEKCKSIMFLALTVFVCASVHSAIIPGDWVVTDTFVPGGQAFTGPYGTWPTAAVDAITFAEYDWNPKDPGQFGFSVDVSVNSLPGEGQDGEVGICHFGDGGNPSLVIEIWTNQYILHFPGVSFNQSSIAPTVGGTDHIELIFIDGLWTLEVNGESTYTVDWGTGATYDPKERLTIGGFNHNIDSGGNGIVRGLDGSISDLTLYDIAVPNATGPIPADNEIQVDTDTSLSWTPGELPGLIEEKLYLGTTSADPNDLTDMGVQTSPYDPGTLALGTAYFWRIDSVYPEGTVQGDVWTFQTVTPITEPIADGLQLWLDASDTSSLTLNGDAVEGWTDKTSNASLYYPANTEDPNLVDTDKAPVYSSTACHQQLPAVTFDGVGQWLVSNVDDTAPLGITNDHTIFVVGQFDKPYVANGQLFSIGNAVSIYGDNLLYRYINKASGDWAQDFISTLGFYQEPANETLPGDAFVASNRRDGSNLDANVTTTSGSNKASDTGTEGPIEWTWINPAVYSIVGATMSSDKSTSLLHGAVSEIVVYNRALSDVEIALMELYLTEKWMLGYCGQPGQIYTPTDLNKDCIVNLLDFSVLVSDWLTSTAP